MIKSDKMPRKKKNEYDKHVFVGVKRQYVEEAKALGFSNFDGYIEYLMVLARQLKSSNEAHSQGEAVPQSSEASK